MNRKVVFWLEPNQSLVPVDQIPGAIAEARYPLPERNEGTGEVVNDTDAVNRLTEERKQANRLRMKYPNLPEDAAFSIGELSSYLADLSFDLEIRQQNDAARAEAEFVGTFDEVVSNGKPIDWRYWMSMKTLTAAQSSRLMVGLDPDVFTSLEHNGPTRNDTSKHRDRARKIERLALNLGMEESTASEWVSWAKGHGFNIHRLFVVEVESKDATAEALEPGNVFVREGVSVSQSESGTTGKPEHKFFPRIGWQVALYEAWPAMRKLYGRDPSPANAIKYLKENDNSGTILTKGGINELWWNPRRGAAKEVAFSTVENTISVWRRRGVLPT